jgi:hypothetical protein
MRYWDGVAWTPEIAPSASESQAKVPFFKKKGFIIPAAILVFLIAISPKNGADTGGTSSSNPNATVDPKIVAKQIKDYLKPHDSLAGASSATCKNLSGFYGTATRTNSQHISQIKKSGSLKNAYVAYDFVAATAWIDGTVYADKFKANLNTVLTQSAKRHLKVGTPRDLVDSFQQQVIKSCEGKIKKHHGIYRDYALTIAKRLDNYISSANNMSDNRPWYPRGYSEYSTGIATKWDNSGGDDCYDCTYAKLLVLSQDGCPNGVYAEVNFLNSAGAVEDWTNDTVPSLGVNGVALLKFESYSATSGGSVSISSIDCN